MNVNILLSGSLKTGGYGSGRPANRDGTYRLELPEGSTVKEVIRGINVPAEVVALTTVNAHRSTLATQVKPGDRVALVPTDVAPFWRHVELMNLGMPTPPC